MVMHAQEKSNQRLDASAQFCLRICDADRLICDCLLARAHTENFSLTDANLNSKEIAFSALNLLLRRNEKVNKLPTEYKAHINPLLCALFAAESIC